MITDVANQNAVLGYRIELLDMPAKSTLHRQGMRNVLNNNSVWIRIGWCKTPTRIGLDPSIFWIESIGPTRKRMKLFHTSIHSFRIRPKLWVRFIEVIDDRRFFWSYQRRKVFSTKRIWVKIVGGWFPFLFPGMNFFYIMNRIEIDLFRLFLYIWS